MSSHATTLPKLARVSKAGNVTPVTDASKNIFSDLRITTDYKNGFPFPVSIVHRNGVVFEVPITLPVDPECPNFVIRKTFHLNKSINVNADAILHEVAERASLETLALREAFQKSQYRIVQQNTYEFAVEYHVLRSQFKDHDYALELEEFDIVICRDNGRQYCHRRSEQGKAVIFEEQQEPNSFLFQILINDPKRRFGNRYMNIHGRVFEVRAKDVQTMGEGVYLTTEFEDNRSRLSDEKFFIKRFTLEDADAALGLYRTRDEALSLGNLEAERKRILEEAQHNRSMDKTKLEAVFLERKRELDTEMLNLEHKLSVSEKQREALMSELQDAVARTKAEREREMLVYKDRYEKRSIDRKDSSEFVKWLPVIFTGAALLFAKLA